jgi:hypothetical protein
MTSNRLTRWLAGRIMSGLAKRTALSRPADFIIGGADNPYMYRWWLIPRNRWLNAYLHRVVRDDDDRALHDHPWCSLSLMLSGLLGEVYEQDVDELGVPQELDRFLRPGDVVWRGATFAHRLFLPPSGPHSEAWTLFVTGPRVREWGFWCRDQVPTPLSDPRGRWVHWKDFTAPNDSSRIGRGCE